MTYRAAVFAILIALAALVGPSAVAVATPGLEHVDPPGAPPHAHGPGELPAPAADAAEAACRPGYEHHPGMGCARGKGDGLYEVTSDDGGTYSTHGADPNHAASHGTTMEPGDPTRMPICRAAGDYRTVILYTYLSGNTNNVSNSRAAIRDVMKRSNHVLNEESLASSSSSPKMADYEVQCTSGEITVSAFASTARGMARVYDSAKAAGFNRSTEKYLIFADFTDPNGGCGYGELYMDSTKSTSNPNNGRSYGVVYKPCWTDLTPMHELAHMMGAAQNGAPFNSGAGHCNDGLDVLCYADGGSKSNYKATYCTGSLKFDCGKDTYFDTLPESGEWLATNWNLGWTGNRFLYVR